MEKQTKRRTGHPETEKGVISRLCSQGCEIQEGPCSSKPGMGKAAVLGIKWEWGTTAFSGRVGEGTAQLR